MVLKNKIEHSPEPKKKPREGVKASNLAKRKAISHAHNEAMTKKTAKFNFPSGLKLEVTNSESALKEWRDVSTNPLHCLQEKFPGETLKDVEKKSADWITRHYIDKVPVIKIKPEDLEKQISKHFKVKDLVKIDPNDKAYMEKDGSWKRHTQFMILHTDGNYYWNVARIDPNLCRVLDDIRDKVGFDLKIDEGVRPYAYNRDMYKAKYGKKKGSSPHISGRAVDLCRTGNAQNDAKLAQAIKDSLAGKGGGWGYGETVYHVDAKIQHVNGEPLEKGNWIVDPKNPRKFTLRMRDWPY